MTAKHLLDQIVRGLDGVTAGPWSLHYEIDGPETQTRIKAGNKALATTAPQCGRPNWRDEMVFNAAHLSRCSPDAIREIAAYVRETEARASAAESTVTALQEALRVAEGALSVLYDNREQAGAGAFVIQLTVDEMTTVRRARTALDTIRRKEK